MQMHFDERLAEQEEQQLLARVAEGDERSFTILMTRYQAKLRAFAHSFADRVNEHPDDISQDVFLQVYLSAARFKGKSKVSTWIFSIARNLINNKIRKKKLLYYWSPYQAEHEQTSSKSNSTDTISEDSSHHLTHAQDKALLYAALMKVSPKYREVLALYEFGDLSYNEISDILNIKIGTVKSRLFNARNELANQFLTLSNSGKDQ